MGSTRGKRGPGQWNPLLHQGMRTWRKFEQEMPLRFCWMFTGTLADGLSLRSFVDALDVDSEDIAVSRRCLRDYNMTDQIWDDYVSQNKTSA